MSAPSFVDDIRPLFTDAQRQCMLFKLDLHSYQDVSKHSDLILLEVAAGKMPMGEPWPLAPVRLFALWIDSGKLEKAAPPASA